jgi:hypothetical protein
MLRKRILDTRFKPRASGCINCETFLSNLHVTTEQFGDERARILSFNRFRECRVEIADGLAIELRALRDSHR